MEKLRDENSTNLHIEGLPLSIDDAVRKFVACLPRMLIFMIAAPVSPYTIKVPAYFKRG
jgi:hypothetical protein